MRGLMSLASKLAALALLGLAVFPAFALFSYFSSAYGDAEAERALLLERFDRARAVAAYVDTTPSADAIDAGKLLPGIETPAVLSANIQSKLREIAQQLEIEVLQASELKPEAIDGLTRLGIRIEMTGPTQSIHSLLQQIEQAQPWLFVDNIQIRSGFADGQAPGTEPPLSVALDVFEFAAAGDGP
jgi:general secretion pathway protein M